MKAPPSRGAEGKTMASRNRPWVPPLTPPDRIPTAQTPPPHSSCANYYEGAATIPLGVRQQPQPQYSLPCPPPPLYAPSVPRPSALSAPRRPLSPRQAVMKEDRRRSALNGTVTVPEDL